CTVDSMFTTTPRFKPRDGEDPKPITSTLPSDETSPTIATTFDVPTSRPTRSFRSSRLPTAFDLLGGAGSLARGELAAVVRLRLVTALAPTDGKTIRVAQVDVTHAMQLRGERGRCDVEE